MNTISKSILAAALYFTACGAPSDGDAKRGSVEPPARGTADVTASSNEVKVIKNGTVSASYTARGAGAALHEQEVMIGLDSPDGKHTLVIYAHGAKAGVYPLGEGQGPGQAWIHFMSDQLPTPAFDTQGGELRLTELSDKHCSGTLTATRTEENGDRYSVEATFSKLPVRSRKQ